MTQIEAIETYQVPGAVGDFDPNNFEVQDGAYGWGDHVSGTMATGIGKFYLGMPKGFCRLGHIEDMDLLIFKDYEQYIGFFNLPYNVPCWKYLDEHGNTLVRGLMPRINRPFICVVLGDIRDKLNCLEITKEDIDQMD